MARDRPSPYGEEDGEGQALPLRCEEDGEGQALALRGEEDGEGQTFALRCEIVLLFRPQFAQQLQQPVAGILECVFSTGTLLQRLNRQYAQ